MVPYGGGGACAPTCATDIISDMYLLNLRYVSASFSENWAMFSQALSMSGSMTNAVLSGKIEQNRDLVETYSSPYFSMSPNSSSRTIGVRAIMLWIMPPKSLM